MDYNDNPDTLADLTDAEQAAKRQYDDALTLLAKCHQDRTDNPCRETLAVLVQARKRVDRALAEWQEAQEEFEIAWEEEFGWP